MKPHRKPSANGGASAGSDLNRRINALVLLLEEKGLLEPGEFEDSLMNLKIQLGDQMPQLARPPKKGHQPRGGGNYAGPERRSSSRQDRNFKAKSRTPVAHISGDVLNDENGDVISGAQLILRRSTEDSAPIQFRSTKSDMQGRFSFLNLPMNTDSEPVQDYIYQIEVRYRNRTLDVLRKVDLNAEQTVQQHIRLNLVEA